MFQKIRQFSQSLEHDFDLISPERKDLLKKITNYIQERYDQNTPINLVYVCTHNSRRSHFGQVAAALAGNFYNLENVNTFSGGTEATAFNPNAIQALKNIGFEIFPDNKESNPVYTVSFGKDLQTSCFSKVYNDAVNPTSDFAAIMTCSDAEQNCPFIPGVVLRIGTTYEDPKKSDGTPEQEATYSARFKQIATETFYAFSLIK